MKIECHPVTLVPGQQPLFLDYCSGAESARPWYAATPAETLSFYAAAQRQTPEHRQRLIALLMAQNAGDQNAGAEDQGSAREASLGALAEGASAAVTGQQVSLFGGPLYTPFKVASALAHARQSRAAGHPQAAIFWLATEDHDFAEIQRIVFPARRELRRLEYLSTPPVPVPVGRIVLDETILPLVEQAWELLGYSDAMQALAAAYAPGATLAQAFADFYSRVFAAQGLLVLDPSGREAHRLGAPVLQAAIERADELHAALLERNRAIGAAGYQAQVAVGERSSLLFLIDAAGGARLALKRLPGTAKEPHGLWQAGRESYSTADLLGILAAEPERISPSALLRPLFQDVLLPTAVYFGGPAEIAYFAQSSVLYERILGRVTPVLPRFSATLVEPAIADLLERHELTIETVFEHTQADLAQRLAARAMPIENKRLLASAGNALNGELAALTEYLGQLSPDLGRSAATSASKMLYQMNRLRRLAANFQLQQEASLGRHAQAIHQALYPDGGLQERLIGAAWFFARHGLGLAEDLVEQAGDRCPGHKLLWL